MTEREIAGLQLFDAGFGVILKTQQHRGLSAGVLGAAASWRPSARRRRRVRKPRSAASTRQSTAMLVGRACAAAGRCSGRRWYACRQRALHGRRGEFPPAHRDDRRTHALARRARRRSPGCRSTPSGEFQPARAAACWRCSNSASGSVNCVPWHGARAPAASLCADEHALVALLAEIGLRRVCGAGSACAAPRRPTPARRQRRRHGPRNLRGCRAGA